MLTLGDNWWNKRVRIHEDWDGAGRTGTAIGCAVFVEQWWVPVKWDDEEDPDWHKQSGLEAIDDIGNSLPGRPTEAESTAWLEKHKTGSIGFKPSKKAGLEYRRIVFLERHENEMRGVPVVEHPALVLHWAKAMKLAGLYSQKTYVHDIASGLLKRVRKWGWTTYK